MTMPASQPLVETRGKIEKEFFEFFELRVCVSLFVVELIKP